MTVLAQECPSRHGGIVVVVGQLLAVVGLAVAWHGASDDLDLADQWSWGALSVAALLVSGVVNALVLVGGRRRLARRRASLGGAAVTAPPAHRAAVVVVEEFPVATTVMTKYHRPGCPLVAGKDTSAAAAVLHEAAGRRPCGVCRP